jgi:hypothetical protein
MMSSSNQRNTTTHSVGSGGSFQSDEDGSEMGHLSVSVSELNQLRQHVRAMRNNMSSKNKKSSSGDSVSVLEEVDLAAQNRANGSAPAGLVVSDEALAPHEKKRVFRLAIIGNIVFVLGAILYVCVAHGDLEWAKDVQGIPVSVLQADDDATWNTWQQTGHARKLKVKMTSRNLQMYRDENQDFNNMLWQDLPYDIKLALMVLGHNQRTWNNAMTSSIEETRWNNLTKEQREAALVIGYTADEWDGALDEEEEMWEATEATYYTTDAPTDDEQDYDDRYENDDEEDDQYGENQVDDQYDEDDQVDDQYDEEDDQYEEDDQLAEDDQYADDQVDDEVMDDDMADDDKSVAAVLTAGEVYEQYKESGAVVTPRPTSAPTNSPTPPPTTSAPEVAQYTVDGDLIPSSTTPADAAQRQQVTPAPEVPRNVNSPEDLMIWGDYDWETLPVAVQKAFEILGYNEELWNTGGVAYTEDLYWSDLTPAQQEQAAVLGYTQALWDQAEDENYDIVSGEQDDGYGDGYDDGYGAAMSDADEIIRVGDFDIETSAVTLFFAALCFMIAGIMNWIRERQVFHMWMVQGGVFGILSALTMGFSDFASLLLQTVSVHCFMLYAFFMLRLRKTIRPVEGLEQLGQALWAADILFFAGSFVSVVMVYWMHMDEDAYYDVGLARGEVFAAWCWFFTATIYTTNTIFLANKSFEEDRDSRTLTIQRKHPNGETYTIRPAAIQLRNKTPCHDVVLT